jgi:serine/threonine-protein kinase
VYGLGLILYELLTGRPPFRGPTARETLEQVRSQEPPPPVQLNPAVPAPVESLCLRCLARNPWRRYARVYDVAMLLGRFRKEVEENAPPRERAARGNR